MNRLLRVLLLICGWTLACQAQQPRVILIHLNDTVQPISADYMARGLDAAAAQHANAVLIEINTPGGLLESMRQMVSKLIASPVPVIVYSSCWKRPMWLRWPPAAMPERRIRWWKEPSSTTS
jgi:membrane-bound ClpP family serine protease